LGVILKLSTPEVIRDTGFSPNKDFGLKRFYCLVEGVAAEN